MPVIINYKMCDNAKECGGVEVCPNRAIFWNIEEQKLKTDNSKCNSCGLCETMCPVHAIMVSKNDAEFRKHKKEIEDDPRTIADLFLDRYGAQPILPAFLIEEDQFEKFALMDHGRIAIEVFKNDSIECMLHSIPIKELLKGGKINYKKVEAKTNKLREKYKIETLPAILFFENGKSIGRIEGYYADNKKEELVGKIRKIIG